MQLIRDGRATQQQQLNGFYASSCCRSKSFGRAVFEIDTTRRRREPPRLATTSARRLSQIYNGIERVYSQQWRIHTGLVLLMFCNIRRPHPPEKQIPMKVEGKNSLTQLKGTTP
ncbi:hypothetical protein RB195_015614 [Necator americanus]|uniref:Uncharacterized protein n=1 Tax=Necator americanus TaxID=51031 RepID=A0ABR1E5U9_NECAM